MKPVIKHVSFGMIIVDDHTYEEDLLIRSSGKIEKRKKRLSKEIYGTSHKMSLDEARFIYEEGVEKLIIGSGHHGYLELSDDAKNLFKEHGIEVTLMETPEAVDAFNATSEKCIGLFHITC
ncbi:hypothetical protein EYV94_16095 [Puteibacter caeruleilacunae]|nr:hypothetical protein EYV94_16095 [Puteibacter caeruleilacunae]